MKVNDIVTFINPNVDEILPDGKTLIYRVIELRGDRVLVELITDKFYFKPTASFKINELKIVFHFQD